MNKCLLCAVVLASINGVMASAADNVSRISALELLAGKKPVSSKVIKTVPTRSADDPVTMFEATEGVAYYYGDLLENGTSTYYINLANMPLIDGEPTGAGQMLRVMVIGEPLEEGKEPEIPEGTFVFPDDLEDPASYVPGTIVMDYTDVLDVFPNPEDPDDEGLYAYSYMPVEGEVSIMSQGAGIYDIHAEFPDMWLWDENYETVLDERPGSVAFLGLLPVKDPYAYNPLPGDTVLDVFGASGRYSDGDYSIAFYSVALDEDGFIVGPGQLMNVELFTEPSLPMNVNDLLGDFTGIDVLTEEIVPGKFGKGLWYEMMPGYNVAICTELTIYTELNGAVRESAIGLADGGTITVLAGEKDGDYKFVFDLVTVEGARITGSWEGPIADYVTDFSDLTGVDSIVKDKLVISGGKGCVYAPQGAEVYTLSGSQCGESNLAPGLYIVKFDGKSVKVFVK